MRKARGPALPSHGGLRRSSLARARGALTSNTECDYSNYVKTKLVRIGNSRGVRIPQRLLGTYGLREGAELEIEERREGLLLRVGEQRPGLLTWTEAYREMAGEKAEAADWADWDVTAGDGSAD
jgi:antitoxin component of MazEF toxin-antitoxin module